MKKELPKVNEIEDNGEKSNTRVRSLYGETEDFIVRVGVQS